MKEREKKKTTGTQNKTKNESRKHHGPMSTENHFKSMMTVKTGLFILSDRETFRYHMCISYV